MSSQHPPPLPFLPQLQAMVQRLRRSRLPALKKVGYLFPLPVSSQSPTDESLGKGGGMTGVLRRQEWDGAMRAWEGVEQRLGR